MVPDPKTNSDTEKTRPTSKRKWISFNEYREEIIQRQIRGTRIGRMKAEQIPNIQSVSKVNPMRKSLIEIFDE